MFGPHAQQATKAGKHALPEFSFYLRSDISFSTLGVTLAGSGVYKTTLPTMFGHGESRMRRDASGHTLILHRKSFFGKLLM